MWAGLVCSVRFGRENIAAIWKSEYSGRGKGGVDFRIGRVRRLDVQETRGDIPYIRVFTDLITLYTLAFRGKGSFK